MAQELAVVEATAVFVTGKMLETEAVSAVINLFPGST